MDDELYRQTRETFAQPRCLYEKAIQYGYFTCRHANKLSLGEREGIHCAEAVAYQRCEQFYNLTLSKSGFALGASRLAVHLTFNKAMKVQIGGMQGAARLCQGLPADPESLPDSPPDIASCLAELRQRVAEFSQLDYSEIIPCIQQFSLRRERQPRKNR